MNNLSTQTLILGTNSITSSGNTMYVDGFQLYPSSNPSGFLTGVPITGNPFAPSINYNLTINWTSGNVFYTTLTGNVSVTFTGQSDGQTIVVSVTNTGTNGYSGTWPSKTSWPNNNTVPAQSSGSYTDIYTFVDITGKIYGSVVQGFK